MSLRCCPFTLLLVTLCPLLFGWVPVTITKVFTPPPNPCGSGPIPPQTLPRQHGDGKQHRLAVMFTWRGIKHHCKS